MPKLNGGHPSHLDPLQTYRDLLEKFNKQSKELQELSAKHYSLNEDWEQSQNLVREYESIMKQYLVKNDDSQDEVDPRACTTELEMRIKGLEQEKADMAKRHRSALVVAADRICAADRKMTEATEQAQAFLATVEARYPAQALGSRRGRKARKSKVVTSGLATNQGE
jgi:hypothetical protein